MHPSPIPDNEIWEGATRQVIAPPGGDMLHPTIAPVEMLIDRDEDGVQRYCARVVLDDADVERINMGERVFWYSQHGDHLHAFSIGWGDNPMDYEGAPDPYPNELTAEEVAALPECPRWMFNHSSIEVPLTEEELEASRATDGRDARRGYWKRGPWCRCGRAFGQHTDVELSK